MIHHIITYHCSLRNVEDKVIEVVWSHENGTGLSIALIPMPNIRTAFVEMEMY